MGQKVRPTGFRTGIFLPWQSTWFAGKKDFAELLFEDLKIRRFILGRYKASDILTAKVGVIIGKKGQEVEKLTKDLETLCHRHIEVKTIEIARPEVDAQLVSQEIAEQLAKRASFRRVTKRALETTMEAGAKGIKVQLSGRLGGAEMARTEGAMAGSVPLSTLRAKVEFGFTEAVTGQGNIGVKVWINNGDFLTEETIDGPDAKAGKVSKKPTRQNKR